MNKQTGFLIALILLAAILVGAFLLKQKKTSQIKIQNQNQSALQQQEKEVENVGILVTPSVQDKNVSFEVSLQTHSVDLEQDLTQISSLKDQTGKDYKPIAWEGALAGGHHRAGNLKFSLDENPKHLTLTINLFQSEATTFDWNIQ